ncbi:MAG: hypothetical protein IT445_06205 [Phycisphaeraceae bacterium]|nr:hypothetical protein [Phycisphaeraceae bacterium]
MMKPLLFILDEGQVLASQHDFSAKMLTLRHHGIHLLANFQNISTAPIEMLGNADVLVSFQCVDSRDRTAFAKAAKLSTPRQVEELATLKTGECVCFLPRCGRGWGQPFRANVPRLDIRTVSDAEVAEMSRQVVEGLEWEPLDEDIVVADGDRGEPGACFGGMAGSQVKSRFGQDAEKFLRDVLNQAHEFSALTARFERSGVRSASRQGQIIRYLTGEGYIKLWSLAVGMRGRPWKLAEPTQKALDEFGVAWKKGRGALPTRAATEFLFRKMSKLPGWQCQKEGILRVGEDEKQVDVLCRDLENKVVAIEIAGSAGHEIHNALHCLRSDEIRKHVVVAVDKKTLEAVRKKFADMPLLVEDSRIEALPLNVALGDWIP